MDKLVLADKIKVKIQHINKSGNNSAERLDTHNSNEDLSNED